MGLIARGDQASKHIAKFGQVDQPFFNKGKFRDREGAIFGACSFGVQLHEPLHFLEGHSEGLRPFDKTHPARRRRRVIAKAPGAFWR